VRALGKVSIGCANVRSGGFSQAAFDAAREQAVQRCASFKMGLASFERGNYEERTPPALQSRLTFKECYVKDVVCGGCP